MKILSLISSGIDSPVATWLMKKKDVEIIGIHFSNEPLTDASPKEKTIKLCNILGLKKLYVVKHGLFVQAELMRNCENKSRCVLCRRMMFRISERIAKKEGCKFLLTGENLGQVASQTLANMYVEDSAITIPILRPLLCNDKQETVDLAKEIGTYEASIESSMCCNAVPKLPVTKARLHIIENEEQKLDIENILKNAIGKVEIIEIKKE